MKKTSVPVDVSSLKNLTPVTVPDFFATVN